MNQTECVLLTGGLGYIGSITAVHLYKFLQEESKISNINYKIIILDNLSNCRLGVLDRINRCIALSLGRSDEDVVSFIEFHQISIMEKEKLRNLFQSKQCEGEPIKYVIHFAGLKAVGESVQKPLFYFQNNVVGSINLFETMGDFNCKNLIFSSSATVYRPGQYLDEESILSPSNPYGETKITIEYIVRSLAASVGGCWISLRYFNPVGATHDGLLGESPADFPNNLFPYIQQVAVGQRAHLNIFGNDYDTPDGTGVRDYIHVVDLAMGHIAALKQIIKKNQSSQNWYDYINLGSGVGYSVLDIVKAYSKALGRDLPYQIAERRPGDVPSLTANPQKAKDILHWQTQLNLDDMCQDSSRFIEMNPNGII